MLLEFNKISFDYLAGKLTLSINCTKNPDVSCEALSLPVYVFEIQLKKQKHLQKSIIPNYIYLLPCHTIQNSNAYRAVVYLYYNHNKL